MKNVTHIFTKSLLSDIIHSYSLEYTIFITGGKKVMSITLNVMMGATGSNNRLGEEMRYNDIAISVSAPEKIEAIMSALLSSKPEDSRDTEQHDMAYARNDMPTRENKKRSYNSACERAEARFKAQSDPDYIPKECEKCMACHRTDYYEFLQHQRKWLKDMKHTKYNKRDVKLTKIKAEGRNSGDGDIAFNMPDYDDIFGFDTSNILTTVAEIKGCLEYYAMSD